MSNPKEGSKRLLIAAGGTGGHIFPALSVLEVLTQRHPDLKVTWLGCSHRMESRLIPSRGIDFIGLRQTEIRRKISFGNIFYNIRTLWFLAVSIFRSIGIVRKLKPDFVLTTGGFAAGALGLASWMTRTPLVIIEPNAYPGLTNRYLGKHAKIIFTAYVQAEKFFPANRTVTTGAPARRDVVKTDRKDARNRLGLADDMLLILATGGSQGARGINSVLPDSIKILRSKGVPVDFKTIHQCGEGKLDNVKIDRHVLPGSSYEVIEFMENLPEYLAASDIVVSRAGASTLSEIACRGLPAIIIPYPESSENHQVINARQWEKSGAAFCIEEKNLGPLNLADKIEILVTDPEKRMSMGENARKFGDANAQVKIADQLEEFLK
jgi:UDP-N-acetylglucosamine--N-acetylmuramyl-(pentapeptide) pyrophosphoryl-undecaprenol N-acetylglucosamine transferase